MNEGYTYTTISAHPGEPVQVHVAFYLNQHAWLEICGTGKPHLAISQGDVSVSIAPACPDQVTEQDAQLARKLADQAATYAAAIERLAAAGGPGDAAA
jgi:hypothetical protein